MHVPGTNGAANLEDVQAMLKDATISKDAKGQTNDAGLTGDGSDDEGGGDDVEVLDTTEGGTTNGMFTWRGDSHSVTLKPSPQPWSRLGGSKNKKKKKKSKKKSRPFHHRY